MVCGSTVSVEVRRDATEARRIRQSSGREAPYAIERRTTKLMLMPPHHHKPVKPITPLPTSKTRRAFPRRCVFVQHLSTQHDNRRVAFAHEFGCSWPRKVCCPLHRVVGYITYKLTSISHQSSHDRDNLDAIMRNIRTDGLLSIRSACSR